MSKEPEIKDYCCINCFVDKLLNDVLDYSDKDYYSIGIIANGELTEKLFRLLASIQDENDEFLFDFTWVDFSCEYDKEYLITITNDLKLCLEQAYYKKENDEGYLGIECDKAFIEGSVDRNVLDNLNADQVTIFGFEDDNKFSD